MLTIKDLSLDKELDAKAMADVRGGHRGHAWGRYAPHYSNSGVVVGGDNSGVIQNGGSDNVGIVGSFNDAFDKNKGTITLNF